MASASFSNSFDDPRKSMYNTNSASVKRLMRESKEMREATELYYCQPTEEDLFEWHFTIRGPVATEFENGIYHGRIILPVEYPMKPPSIILLTESGRFKTNEKICLSISGHHVETWTPTWGIRTALLAIIGFMETPGEGALGSLDYPAEERRILAKKSLSYVCPKCAVANSELLLPITEKSIEAQKEAKQLGNQINFVKKSENLTQNEKVETENVSTENEGTNRSTAENRPMRQVRNESNSNFLSMLIFLCSLIFSFLLLRRIFLTFGGNRTFHASEDPFHDDF